MKLVIVEKPSMCMELFKVLGATQKYDSLCFEDVAVYTYKDAEEYL